MKKSEENFITDEKEIIYMSSSSADSMLDFLDLKS